MNREAGFQEDRNVKHYKLIRRKGSAEGYPISEAWYKHKVTGEIVKGTFNESSGEKKIGQQ